MNCEGLEGLIQAMTFAAVSLGICGALLLLWLLVRMIKEMRDE
jgi:threonine/homoserine/homoserine lactone efflux protein